VNSRLSCVVIKHYRFEVAFLVVAALLATALGVVIHLRLSALAVSQDCLEAVRASLDGSGLDPGCFQQVRAGSEILGSTYLSGGGVLQITIMGLLPFALGVFGGIPVVARDLEDRTAQTAWWLYGSRNRWLSQRVGPVLLVAAVAIALAAGAASLVADDWIRWYGPQRAQLVGLYGLPAVARAFGAFGIGLSAGAILGRTFPAFVASVAVLLLIVALTIQAREAWLAQLPLSPIWERSAVTGRWEFIGGVPRAVAWGGPQGEILTPPEAYQRAYDAGVPRPDPSGPSPAAEETWLNENGYAEINLGTTDAAAAGWAPVDAVTFAAVGVLGVAATFVIANRRRPS
jgi:hypothetical protein